MTATPRVGERRLPMALAVIVIAGLTLIIPDDFRLSVATRWLYPLVLVVLLIVLMVGDPGRIDRENRWLRVMTSVLIGAILVGTSVSALRLVIGILTHASPNAPPWISSPQVLEVGAFVLVTNVIGFALLFWHLDAGGPAARAHHRPEPRRAFTWPEQSLPELEGAGWYPQFVDYLALSFNTCTAFSPTDVSAVKHWAKLVMLAESSISLTLVTLVIASAINAL